jgi:hypothetical protein
MLAADRVLITIVIAAGLFAFSQLVGDIWPHMFG